MRKKKLAIVAVCAALSVAAMTGCSKGGDAKKDSSSSSPKASIETSDNTTRDRVFVTARHYGNSNCKA